MLPAETMKIMLLVLISLSHSGFASTNCEGFFTPSQVPRLPISDPHKTVFKLEIGQAEMHGTAFAISSELLVTNAHNIRRCLLDHGLEGTGYSNEKGPLQCDSLDILSADEAKKFKFSLLGSTLYQGGNDLDFAIIRVPGLNAKPVTLVHNTFTEGSELFVIGYPGETFRSKAALQTKLNSLDLLFKIVFDSGNELSSLDLSQLTSEELMLIWLNRFFIKLQPHVAWSDYLSGELLGKEWLPLMAWQSEPPNLYLRNLTGHLDTFKKTLLLFQLILERSYISAIEDYNDADGKLRVSKSIYSHSVTDSIHILEGDATPGSSGSLVLDTEGNAVGILNSIRVIDFKTTCSRAAMGTNWESINFQRCSELGVGIISSGAVIEKLQEWGIDYSQAL